MNTEHDAAAQVEEIQGIYGPFTFPEALLQKIWCRREFAPAGLTTVAGERLEVLEPGRWNHLGGPDFRDARLLIDGREVRGDVELHLHARDWQAHGHAADEAYDGVVLHVVLFPPPGTMRTTRGAAGRRIPLFVLLPWLHHDLEEYAAEAAMENLAGRPASQLGEWLDDLPAGRAEAELAARSARRWRAKVHFASVRWRRLGWTGACHHTALEVLGYRFNRAPMLRVAGRRPLADWAADPDGAVECARLSEADAWRQSGVRPVNRPERRLLQYADWVRRVPDWPEQWARLARELAGAAAACRGVSPGEARRRADLAGWRHRIGEAVCGGVLSGPRLDTLICDGLLPLWCARSGDDLGEVWQVWYPGDQPAELTGHLRRLGIIGGRERPAAHGPYQGLLDWLMERSGL
ncbi:MAG: DUF2851 family protein [Verrucomicrobiota bacterium]